MTGLTIGRRGQKFRGSVSALPNLPRFQRPDGRLELRRAHADEAHEVRVAAAVRLVAEAPDELRDACVLAFPAATVERLDGDHAVQRRLALVVVAEADRRSSRMAGERDAAQPG